MIKYKNISWDVPTYHKHLNTFLEEYMEKFPFRVRDENEAEYYRKIFRSKNVHKKYPVEKLFFWRGYIENNPPKTPYFLFYLLDKIKPTEQQIKAGYMYYAKKEKKVNTEFNHSTMDKILSDKKEKTEEEEKTNKQMAYWEQLQKNNPEEAEIISNKAKRMAYGSSAALKQNFAVGGPNTKINKALYNGCILAILEQKGVV